MPELETLYNHPWLPRIALLVLVAALLIVFVRIGRKVLISRIRDADQRYRARKFFDFLAYILFVILLLFIFDTDLGGIGISIGIIGAGVAFALQEVITSIAGWFAITFAHFYKPGDRVQLAGIRGDVIDVGVIRTTVMEVGEWVKGDLYGGRVVRITNAFVFKEPVFNYSGEFPFLWDEIEIPIRYGSDYELTRQIMHEILWEVSGDYARTAKEAWSDMVRKFLIENARIEPMITMRMDENWATYTLRYVVDYKLRRSTKNEIFTRILKAIDDAGGKIQIPTASLNVTLLKNTEDNSGN